MKCVGVEFKSGGKQYTFFDNDIEVNCEDYVIVETERGLQFGKVCVLLGELNDGKEHTKVVQIAKNKEIKQNETNIKDAKKALEKAQELAEKLSLEMKFLDAYFTFDRKQLIFQFLADNRVDFRELAKSLASIYKTRIELRQVGVRDKAKEISGIGQCGRKLCCSSFLKDLDSVGIAQVKNQNLSLNPNKINGLCGRLLCCLTYKNETYEEYRKELPNLGERVKYKEKSGKVVSLDILNKSYTILTDDEEYLDVNINDSTK